MGQNISLTMSLQIFFGMMLILVLYVGPIWPSCTVITSYNILHLNRHDDIKVLDKMSCKRRKCLLFHVFFFNNELWNDLFFIKEYEFHSKIHISAAYISCWGGIIIIIMEKLCSSMKSNLFFINVNVNLKMFRKTNMVYIIMLLCII